MVSVADVTSHPGFYSTLVNRCAQRRSRRAIKRNDVFPGGGSLAHVGSHTAIHEENAYVRKIIFARFERLSWARPLVHRAEAPIDGGHFPVLASHIALAAFE